MELPDPSAKTIDYRQAKSSQNFVPNPAVLSSSGWDSLHLEIHHQPKFEIAEHDHTMHIIACGLPDPCEETVWDRQVLAGERWLDGKVEPERRRTGDIAIIPAGIAHRCNWNTTVQFGILALEPNLLKQVGQDWVDPDRIELIPQFMSQQDIFIQGIFSTLRADLETGGIGSYILVDSLKTALAIHLLRNYCTSSPQISSYPGGLSTTKLNLVKDYIQEHLHEELKLVDLAAIANLSSYHFLRLFKQKLNTTPHQYILRIRIQQAKYLLQHSELSLTEIANKVGFCDQSHLTRWFKRSLGMTPHAFLQAQSQE